MIRFLCDSTSDLTLELRERYNITLLPFHIALDELEQAALFLAGNEIFFLDAVEYFGFHTIYYILIWLNFA